MRPICHGVLVIASLINRFLIAEVLFNILAPAVIQDHVTFGLTKEVGTNQEFNFSAGYAVNNSVEGHKCI